jgi:cytochrome c oxidase subunit 2
VERSLRRKAKRILSAAVLLAPLLEPTRAPGEQPASRSFEITASRFQYEPARLEVSEGDAVRLTLHSTDTTHGFGIKELKVEAVIPKGGEPVTVEFVADQAGTFEFFCTEYCGAGHRSMRGTLVVVPRSAPTSPPSPSPGQAAGGGREPESASDSVSPPPRPRPSFGSPGGGHPPTPLLGGLI